MSYRFTKYIGKKTVKTRSSACMKIVDTLVVTQDKSIMVLKANDKYYLLSVSPSDIKLITELEGFDENNLPTEIKSGNVYENIDFKNIDFKSILEQLMPNKKK